MDSKLTYTVDTMETVMSKLVNSHAPHRLRVMARLAYLLPDLLPNAQAHCKQFFDDIKSPVEKSTIPLLAGYARCEIECKDRNELIEYHAGLHMSGKKLHALSPLDLCLVFIRAGEKKQFLREQIFNNVDSMEMIRNYACEHKSVNALHAIMLIYSGRGMSFSSEEKERNMKFIVNYYISRLDYDFVATLCKEGVFDIKFDAKVRKVLTTSITKKFDKDGEHLTKFLSAFKDIASEVQEIYNILPWSTRTYVAAIKHGYDFWKILNRAGARKKLDELLEECVGYLDTDDRRLLMSGYRREMKLSTSIKVGTGLYSQEQRNNKFIKALLSEDIENMNLYFNLGVNNITTALTICPHQLCRLMPVLETVTLQAKEQMSQLIKTLQAFEIKEEVDSTFNRVEPADRISPRLKNMDTSIVFT